MEDSLKALFLEKIELKKQEKFYLSQLKKSKDRVVIDIYLEILKLSEISNKNLEKQQFSNTEQLIDALGIHRFILKYMNMSIATDKIEEYLFCKRVH